LCAFPLSKKVSFDCGLFYRKITYFKFLARRIKLMLDSFQSFLTTSRHVLPPQCIRIIIKVISQFVEKIETAACSHAYDWILPV
jgi:hypothetical protein